MLLKLTKETDVHACFTTWSSQAVAVPYLRKRIEPSFTVCLGVSLVSLLLLVGNTFSVAGMHQVVSRSNTEEQMASVVIKIKTPEKGG